MTTRRQRLAICCLPIALGCGSHQASAPVQLAPPPPPEPPAEHVPPPPDPSGQPQNAAESRITTWTGLGLKTPESALYDPDQDVYFVSNINGRPADKDDNGFISKVTPDGKCELLFIDGAKPNIQLHAPKGLALQGGLLYVTDIDRVRAFDAKTGAPQQEIELRGSTFVNDIGAGTDGSLYVTDSGFKADFSPSGTDAVYKITSGKPKVLVHGAELGHPNGIFPGAGGAWVVTYGTGELYWINDKGARESVQKLPKGKNDGVLATANGRMLISSWEGASVLGGTPGSDFTEVLGSLEAPADIGFDAKRNRLLIPLFMKDSLVLYQLDVAP